VRVRVDWSDAPTVSGEPARARVLVAVAMSALVASAMAALVWAGWQIRDFRASHEDRVLPGVVVEGAALGGLDRAQALAAVDERLAPRLHRGVRVWFGDQAWEVSPAALGATSDAAAVVDEALAASRDASVVELARIRFGGQELGFTRGVAVTAPAPEAVAGFIGGIAAELDQPPVDAAFEAVDGEVVLRPEEFGLTTDVENSTEALRHAIVSGEDEVALGVGGTPPAVTTADYKQVIVLDQSDRETYLYLGGELVRTYRVAVGTSGYPTPVGHFTVGAKRRLPTWYNPSPNGWGADMPASIGPGPANPLGVRALNWVDEEGVDDGIRFHGTNAVASLGQAASHGCVRMSNADVVDLYDLVDVGARVISVP